jgi:hypothetical protein
MPGPIVIISGPQSGATPPPGSFQVFLAKLGPDPLEIGADLINPQFNLTDINAAGPLTVRQIQDDDGNPLQNFLGIPDPLTMPFTYQKTVFGATVGFLGTEDDGGGPASDGETHTWLPRAFYGISANPALTTEAGIEALPQSSLESARAINFTVSPTNEYVYYSWPTAYGAFDPLSFQIGPFPGGFISLGTVNLTANTPGAPVNQYEIARSTNLLTGAGILVQVS